MDAKTLAHSSAEGRLEGFGSSMALIRSAASGPYSAAIFLNPASPSGVMAEGAGQVARTASALSAPNFSLICPKSSSEMMTAPCRLPPS